MKSQQKGMPFFKKGIFKNVCLLFNKEPNHMITKLGGFQPYAQLGKFVVPEES